MLHYMELYDSKILVSMLTVLSWMISTVILLKPHSGKNVDIFFLCLMNNYLKPTSGGKWTWNLFEGHFEIG